MRRMVIAVTALLCLAFAGSAYAATVAPTATNNGYIGQLRGVGWHQGRFAVTMVETARLVAGDWLWAPYPLTDILTNDPGDLVTGRQVLPEVHRCSDQRCRHLQRRLERRLPQGLRGG